MNRLLWLLLVPFFTGCTDSKDNSPANSDAPEKEEYFHEPEGYKGQDGADE